MYRSLVTLVLFSLALCDTLSKTDFKVDGNYEGAYEHYIKKCGLTKKDEAIVTEKNRTTNGRLVGGHNAQMGQFQSIVSIRRTNVHVGGGVLIHINWVLTAATITLEFSRPVDLQVVLGVVNTGTIVAPGFSLNGQDIIRHQGFQISNAQGFSINNIALVRIASVTCNAARFGSIAPIFMDPINIENVAGSVVAGWGSTNFLSFSRTAEFNFTAPASCEGVTGIPSGAICAVPALCALDIGGPLISGSGLIGIASSGGCDPIVPDRPNVYMRISHYRMWIFQVTGI